MKYLWGSRLLATALALGGAAGVFLSVVALATLGGQSPEATLKVACSAFIYVVSLVVGVSLWRQRRLGMVWAPILFALQIPVLALPHLSYEWFTGAAVNYRVAAGVRQWVAQVGASDNFSFATHAITPVYGVNLVALVAALYLFAARPNNSSKPTPLRGAA